MRIGFMGSLILLLITLKLIGYISISWLTIFAIPIVGFIMTVISLFIIFTFIGFLRRR